MELSGDAPGPVDGIRVGIGGWTYAPWRDNFYPKGLVQRRELEYASRHVSSIEINGTYYGTQKPATYAKWRDETPDGFVFSAKAPMRIMQAKSLAKTGPQVEDFVGGIAGLGDKLGPLVWQFDAGIELQRDAFEAFCALLRKPRTAAHCATCWTCAIPRSSMPASSGWRAGTASRPSIPIRRTIPRSPTSPRRSCMRG